MQIFFMILVITAIVIAIIAYNDYLRRDEIKANRKKVFDFLQVSLMEILNRNANYKKKKGVPINALIVEYLNGNDRLDKLISDNKINNVQEKTAYSIEKAADKIMNNQKAYYEFRRRIENLKQKKQFKNDEDLVKNLSAILPDLSWIFARIYNDKNIVNNNININELCVWIENDCLCLVSKEIDDVSKIEISLNDIVSFSRDGDVFNETHITGGGGGGSSLTGAVVGGVIAGGAGAVIGSRKKINGIKSDNVIVDKRTTILEYKESSEVKYMFFSSDAYEAFLKLIPSRQFNFVQRDKNTENKLDKSDSNDAISQIKELSELKEQGILTEKEFSEKKKILLDKIK